MGGQEMKPGQQNNVPPIRLSMRARFLILPPPLGHVMRLTSAQYYKQV